MISRYYVICSVCKTHHTLRVQMGYGDEQRHRFHCHHCNEPISFNLLASGIEAVGADLTELSSGEHGATCFQYLSSDFVADAQSARDPMYFGSMELMSKLLASPQGIKAMSEIMKGRQPNKDTTWFALKNAAPDWAKLLVCWRLERNGRYALAMEKLSAIDSEAGTSSWHEAARFGMRLFDVNHSLLAEAGRILRENKEAASRLTVEHGYRWMPEFEEAEFFIFSEFFDRWDAFSQVYLYIQNDIKMPREAAATSVDFERVRGFYSLAQEFFAKQVRLLTALNNIKENRSFDELKKISLEKYLNTDNAKRRDNFKDNAIFFSATEEYDSGLRNAEAHNWLRANAETQTLSYRQGGDGAEVRLRYVDYLYKSTRIFRQICHLMQLEVGLRLLALEQARELLIQVNADVD